MKNIELAALTYGDLETTRKALRSVQTRKSRLRNQKDRVDYNELMTEILKEEQLLKEVRDYFNPKSVPVPKMTWEDIVKLNIDETNRAIKSIQSKKCNTQHLTDNIKDNIEYQKACEIEEMLLKHKENIKPIEESVVRRSDINNLIRHIETLDEKISKEYILEKLQELAGSEEQ